ncbi:MAG: polysaccharide deacetylase family protein [Clostridia bacterium]|nr:polysaccharide deacetylase family protein [Clostridia bacterium]
MFTPKRYKKLACILPFLLLLSACQATPKITPPPARPLETQSYVEPIPVVPDIALPSYFPDGEWDVSNIDVSEIDPSKKLIAFTFDDAPSKTLENILAVFASFNETHLDCKANATVFCNGHLINQASLQTLHAVSALGFELGNHTYSHPNLTKLSPSEIQTEIENTDALLKCVDGQPIHLFRAPFGAINETVKSLVTTPVIDWTIDTLDWSGVSEEEVYNSVFNQKFDGAIVLMHDGYPNTVSALKRLLPDLAAENYQVVSVSQMAKVNGCALKTGKVYIRARKSEA